ncbi:cobalamin biosynthesis protein CobD [Flexivirga sp. ID2601S]|uniref:Cobalamin biosynthesis protein CobD n=1 Tax=Flexivirga aerilata TaxID=1656889 RepID=A0A849AUR1_9MICO|nr:adenosylcobinamide-phosphate synthase CbiB [Flexivirga aerilata]NNG40432.1 cobalamin biosynthesis protein CobD [Flexivirga aerilata]
MRSDWPRATGLLAGCALDRAFGDPRRGHPVALFGSAAARLERRFNDGSVAAGLLAEAVAVLPVVALGAVLERRGPLVRCMATAGATFVVLGGHTLAREATLVADQLAVGDLPSARRQVTHLVGRVTDELTEPEIVRAATESVAENSSDAVVAPLVWGGVVGVPGLIGYRAINTLDAMWGHRTARFERFGKAAARLDDAANLLPARLTALLVAAVRPGEAAVIRHTVARDAKAHPSPNAGVVESAFAAALGVRLGGRNVYASGPEDRGTLGDGGPPAITDLRSAVRLLRQISVAAAAVSVAVSLRRPGR